MPRVSIGLPVYNGEKYVREAIESVLAQTFKDFELIISDNASTDQTEKICQEYAAKDPRVHYYRNAKNLGAAKNFNRVFELSSGEYFKWLAADDCLKPRFISDCIKVLEANPDVVLVCSKTTNYDENTEQTYLVEGDLNLSSPKISARFSGVLWRCLPANRAIWGLMRRRVLEQTHLIRSFIGADDCLLIEMAMKGKFVQLPEALYHMNSCHSNAFHILKYLHGREGIAETRWYDPENKARIVMPYWRRLWEYLLLVLRGDASFGEKIFMVMDLFYFSGRTRYRRLVSEIIHAMGLGPFYSLVKKALIT